MKYIGFLSAKHFYASLFPHARAPTYVRANVNFTQILRHIQYWAFLCFIFFLSLKCDYRAGFRGGRGAGPHQKSARGGRGGVGGFSLPRRKVKKKIPKMP